MNSFEGFEPKARRNVHASLIAKPLHRRGKDIPTHAPARHIGETFSRIAGLLGSHVKVRWHRTGNPDTPDCSIMVVPTIAHSAPEIGQELYDGNFNRHLFLVSLDDRDENLNHARAIIDDAPSTAWLDPESTLLIPGFHKNQSGNEFDSLKPTTQGTVSVYTVMSMHKKYEEILQRIHMILALKYQDFKRTDLDKDGKTIKEEMFEGWPQFLVETDEQRKRDLEGEEWKGGETKDWTPDDE